MAYPIAKFYFKTQTPFLSLQLTQLEINLLLLLSIFVFACVIVFCSKKGLLGSREKNHCLTNSYGGLFLLVSILKLFSDMVRFTGITIIVINCWMGYGYIPVELLMSGYIPQWPESGIIPWGDLVGALSMYQRQGGVDDQPALRAEVSLAVLGRFIPYEVRDYVQVSPENFHKVTHAITLMKEIGQWPEEVNIPAYNTNEQQATLLQRIKTHSGIRTN